jgi:hypothetical protein
MNVGTLFRAFDAAVALRDAARKFTGASSPQPPGADPPVQPASPALVGQIETRLTGVVVAALKEAFDRDHARLELERAQMEEQRRRADEALRLELRRQAVDREVSRLRMLGGAALVGWIASVAIVVARLGAMTPIARGVAAAGWLLLLGALGAAFSAQGRLNAAEPRSNAPLEAGSTATSALWLLVVGLAVSAAALLI